MISKAASRPWRLASSLLILLSQSLSLAQETRPLRQFGIAADCDTFVTANPGDICFDTAQAADITLAQFTMWNPVLGGPDGERCPTQFLAGYQYCVGVSGPAITNGTNNQLASPGPFTLNATNATFTPFQAGAAIAAFNGSFYIGVDPLVTCQDCPNNGYLFSVSDDRSATVSPISGPHRVFVSNSTGALSYVKEEEENDAEETGDDTMERLEKGFTFTEGGFIEAGSGVFEFGIMSGQELKPLEWEACEVMGMEMTWKVFVQGIGMGRSGDAQGEELGECVAFMALGRDVS
ncbi:MAG: hypothetical protein Q9169_000155 [Polycauliona sp. 2 TL-2023]